MIIKSVEQLVVQGTLVIPKQGKELGHLKLSCSELKENYEEPDVHFVCCQKERETLEEQEALTRPNWLRIGSKACDVVQRYLLVLQTSQEAGQGTTSSHPHSWPKAWQPKP